MKKIKIGNKIIGKNNPCFIIAEAGVNHNKDILLAKKMIDIAKSTNSDTIKFHAYKTDEIYIKEAETPKYVKKNIGKNKSYYNMAEDLRLNDKELFKIKDYCDSVGIHFSCTPYGNYGINIMNKLNCDFFKISSTYLTCTPFLKEIAKSNKPIVLSTGMGDLNDVKKAIIDINEENNHKLVIMHCTTNYPCPYKDVNLNVIKTYINEFNYPIGYSDHTKGIIVSVLASKIGASIVEKHFTLSRKLEGPDHKASLEPKELKKMVDAIKYFGNKEISLFKCAIELRDRFKPKELINKTNKEIKQLVITILGSKKKIPSEKEINIIPQARLSVVSKVKIPKNTIITETMLKYTRPGNGISPRDYKLVIGRKSLLNIPANKLLKFEEDKISFEK